MGLVKMFWDSSLAEIKNGYIYDPSSEDFVCLICGERFTKGRIYQEDDLLLEAEKAAKTHIAKLHGSTFEFLVGMDKKYTSLTGHQQTILTAFYEGLDDKAIAAKMENANTSTIRNHRFAFREKAKQAKIFLAIMELLAEHSAKGERFIDIPRCAASDDSFITAEQENEEFVKTYFKEGADGPLSTFPKKEKRKIAVLKQLIQRFDPQRKYTEKEVNDILNNAYHDYVTLRRNLIEYGFMDRYPDGSCYWVKTDENSSELMDESVQ